ncbi:phosphatase PAP2 family protein [Halobacteriovorax sp. GFR7]|uniref:phosphatase PAP2 family protein n=1 Tax=unclassified Halobacteriovorax TaxID=2639665 RepID=UPI003713FD99
MKFRQVIILILILCSFQRSFANECGSFLSDLTAPICTDAKYIFWTGTGITLGLRLLKEYKGVDEIQKRAAQKNHLKELGKFGGDIGYGVLNGAYIIGQYFWGGKLGKERASHMLQATAYTVGTTVALKTAVDESRPGYPDEKDSFPSGHASASFAFASVVTAQHGWGWGSAAHLAAIFISFSRLNDSWHYLHDVTAGMTIGLSYGWGIYFNHVEYNKPYWLSILPTAKLDGLTLSFSQSF